MRGYLALEAFQSGREVEAADFGRFRSISSLLRACDQGLASWCLCRTWHSFGNVDMERAPRA